MFLLSIGDKFISRKAWFIIASILISLMISFIGVFEISILKRIIGIYQLASLVVISLIVLYLLLPMTINNYTDLLFTSIILSLTVVFVYIHSEILWSSTFSGTMALILPFSAVVKIVTVSNIIRPVLEIDWGQITITLILLKVWINILKYLRSLKF